MISSGVDVKDPILECLSLLAEDDKDYQSILADLDKYMEARELGDDSLLKKMRVIWTECPQCWSTPEKNSRKGLT